MIKEYEKLNHTGSYYRDTDNNTYYSYNTPIYRVFKIGKRLLRVFNNTYYSVTTRKHQAITHRIVNKIDLELFNCPYGNWALETVLRKEITATQYELEKLNNKTRKLGKRQAEQKEYLAKRLQELLSLQEEI